MSPNASLTVLFSAAAGPRLGFGHLVRCGVLARVLGVEPVIVLRGARTTARRARRLGWTVRTASSSFTPRPDLIVVDDPSARQVQRWVRAARAASIPAATIHDLGLARVEADLTIDGSVTTVTGASPADLAGPRFAILDSAVLAYRQRRVSRRPHHVLVALGGGAHVRLLGARLAMAIGEASPAATIDLAAGFGPRRGRPALPPHARWIDSPNGLARALATASVAVTAGGVTVYEACALGTPTVTLAVTSAQRATTRALANAGAVIDASAANRDRAIAEAAQGVAHLLRTPRRAARLGETAAKLIDGRGVFRVAARLRTLAGLHARGGHRHAA